MKTLFLTLALLALPSFASAQTAVNPSTLTFAVSADHSVVVGGVELTTSYIIDIYQGVTLVLTENLGKPTPNAAGDVTVPLVQGGLAKNTVYTLYVTAVGPGGSTRSAISVPFVWLAAPRAVGNVRVI